MPCSLRLFRNWATRSVDELMRISGLGFVVTSDSTEKRKLLETTKQNPATGVQSRMSEKTFQRIRRKAKGGPSLMEAVKEVRARGAKPGRRQGPTAVSEAEHFNVCPVCGQAFDMRRLEEGFYHAIPGHKPKQLDS